MKTVKDLSILELKSAIYDRMEMIGRLQNEIRQLTAEIESRAQNGAVGPIPKLKKEKTMSVNLSIGLEYTPKTHHGHEVNLTTSKYVIYTESAGFEWDTLSCTEAEAIAKQQAPSMGTIIVELKFMPVA